MSRLEIDKSYFVAFCIEQYKIHIGFDGSKAAEAVFNFGLADYLAASFDVLHTQSRQWLIEEMDEYLKNRQ